MGQKFVQEPQEFRSDSYVSPIVDVMKLCIRFRDQGYTTGFGFDEQFIFQDGDVQESSHRAAGSPFKVG